MELSPLSKYFLWPLYHRDNTRDLGNTACGVWSYKLTQHPRKIKNNKRQKVHLIVVNKEANYDVCVFLSWLEKLIICNQVLMSSPWLVKARLSSCSKPHEDQNRSVFSKLSSAIFSPFECWTHSRAHSMCYFVTWPCSGLLFPASAFLPDLICLDAVNQK